MKRHKTKRNRKKHFSLTTLVVLALIIGGAYAAYRINQKADAPATSDSAVADDGDINLEPATKEEQAKADKTKEDAANQDDGDDGDEPTAPEDKKSVQPVVSYAGFRDDNVEVRAYVGEVYETGGTCTATFRKGGQTVTGKSDGDKDATYTRCDRIVILHEDFPSAGNWSLVVSYESSTAAGSSNSQTVAVP